MSTWAILDKTMGFSYKFSYQGQGFGFGGGKPLYRTRDASLAEMFV